MTSIKVSVFLTILYLIWQLPSVAPKQPTVVQNNPIVEVVKAETSVASPDASPTQQSSPIVTKSNDIEQMIKDTFGSDAEMATKIAKCESNLNPEAIGDNFPIKGQVIPSIGVFQIRLLPERGITAEEMKNPAHNIEYAKMLFDKHGFQPWTCYRKVK